MGRLGKMALFWLLLAGLVLLPQASVLAAPESKRTVQNEEPDGEKNIEDTETNGQRDEPQNGSVDESQKFRGDTFEETLTADYTLSGLFDRCTAYFSVGEWNVESAVFVMYFSASQLLDHEVSYFTLYVNQLPVSTQYIEQTPDGTGTVSIDIPAGLVRAGETNSITVEVYLRGKDTEACVDDSSVSSWMNIFRESFVRIGYETLNQADTIAEFYRKFTSIEATDTGQSAVLVPKGAGEAVLTAMAGILSGVSVNAVRNYQNIQCAMTLQEEDIKSVPYAFYISEYAKLPSSLKNLMSSRQKQLAQSKAVACLLSVQEEGKVLLITGKDEASIANAGKLFSNAEYVEQLKTDTALIDAEGDYLTQEHNVKDYVTLTENGVQVNGTFRQEVSFQIDYPANRKLAASSQLSLDFKYSANLNFEKSLLTVYVNDSPAGSRRLTKEGAEGMTALFDIPQDLEIKGSFTVKVVFDLEPEDDWCRLSPEETPWGYVAETSMLKLASMDNTVLAFSEFPSPFIRDGHMNQVQIILPEEPGNGEIGAMGGLLLTMGRYLKDNTGSLEVKKGLEGADLAGSNLIAIGIANNNEILRQNEDKLSFRYDGDGEPANGMQPVEAAFAEKSGTAQLISNPYGDTFHGILIISGYNEDGLSAAVTYLRDTDELWKVSGDAYLTDGETLLESHNTSQEEAEQPVKASTLPQEAKPVILMAASILILAILAGIMLIINYRKEGKDE